MSDRCTDTLPHGPHRGQFGPWGVIAGHVVRKPTDCPGVPITPANAPDVPTGPAPAATTYTPAVMTETEHRAMDLTAELWNALCVIAGTGPARPGDLAELCAHIHAIQHAILAQAAARAYPDRYRLMGGDPVTPPDPSPEPTGFITTAGEG